MRIGEQIKNYRKTAGLTQEQVANYLGVSTPAVNKWEKGNTYPDISLLPALARLLKIDMNELFSFREELTEKEIGQFVNELSEVSLDSFTEAFEMASRKIQEYPHCDLLIYTIATVLNGSLTLSDLNDEERMEYNTAIIEWLERTADSQDERVRNSSVFILATKYVQMEKYEEANVLLKKIPDTVIDATIMKTSVLAHQEGTDTAALFLEGKLLQADVEKCVQLIKQLLSESQNPWNMTQSPLYYRYEDTAQGKAFSGVGKNFVRELYSEIENKKEYEFLRGNKELEAIFEEHLK